jgi:hypothetical protein
MENSRNKVVNLKKMILKRDFIIEDFIRQKAVSTR